MGRKSKIEIHPYRKIIIKRLASGNEYSEIIRDFPELKWDDLDYYAKNKLPKLLSKSANLKEEIESDQANDTLAEVRSLKAKAVEILNEAQGAGDLKTALLSIREARGCLEAILKAEGRIQEQNLSINLQQVSIFQSPEWSLVGDILARILGPYPDLRREVAAEFIDLERGRK